MKESDRYKFPKFAGLMVLVGVVIEYLEFVMITRNKIEGPTHILIMIAGLVCITEGGRKIMRG